MGLVVRHKTTAGWGRTRESLSLSGSVPQVPREGATETLKSLSGVALRTEGREAGGGGLVLGWGCETSAFL